MEPVNIGLLGLGTVGGGTVTVLTGNAGEIARRAGRGIHIAHAAAREYDPQRISGLDQIGRISDGRLIQAKGRDFSLVELLGGDNHRAAAFQEGGFATLYLSPRDYHRVHMPCDARLVETVYIPGRLFSVAPHTTRTIPGLFTRNERLAALFETPAGPIVMVLVGAIFVACMETVWEGVIRSASGDIRVHKYPREGDRHWQFRRGDEIGRFNMGSTVILLHGPGQAEWNPERFANQSIRIGEILGRFISGP